MKKELVEMSKRIYIPRTKVAIGTIIVAEHVKRNKKLKSTGKALELMLLESPTFNAMLDELKKDKSWKFGEFDTEFEEALCPSK